MKQYYVYIVTNKPKGTLYTSITSNLSKRIWEHRNKAAKGFTNKYNLDKLVYYEIYDDPENAIKREKRLKFWLRNWKLELITEKNPTWKDLYEDICA